jgi:hypothetical protein
MKRKIVFLLILLGIVGCIVAIVQIIKGKAPKQGVLKINANPASSVFLDNKHLGKTPYQDNINEGEYEIKLVSESTTVLASSWQGKVKVYGNLLTYINADLAESDFNSASDILWLEKITSNQSEISVITNPDGAAISIDGESKGITPSSLTGISPGDHTIAVSSPGFAPRSFKAKTTVGYKLFVVIKLALSSRTDDLTTTLIATSSASPSSILRPTPLSIVKETLTPTEKITPTGISGPNPVKPYVIIKETPTGFLRVRTEPTTQSSESARVNPGETYPYLDTKNGWFQISVSESLNGWISGQYGTKVE